MSVWKNWLKKNLLLFFLMPIAARANDIVKDQQISSFQKYGEKIADDVAHKTKSDLEENSISTPKLRSFFANIQICYQHIEEKMPFFYSFNTPNTGNFSDFLYKSPQNLLDMQKCYIKERIILNFSNNPIYYRNYLSLLYPMYGKEDKKDRFVMKERVLFPSAEDRAFLRKVVLPRAFDVFNQLNKD